MQASLTRASAVSVTPAQATTSGRGAPCQSSTILGGPYPHFRFSSALSSFKLPLANNTTADSQRSRPKLVCFAVPASVPDSANEVAVSLKPLPRAVENVADDPSLHNPLQRLHRLGPGWFGVILEYEGVLVEDTSELHSKAWQMLGDEEGKPRPFNWALKRAEGMKSEQVVLLLALPVLLGQHSLCCTPPVLSPALVLTLHSGYLIAHWYMQTVQEVFCWSRNPMEVRRLTARKEEIYRQLLGDRTPLVPSGVRHLIDVLGKHQVSSPRPAAHAFMLLGPLSYGTLLP